ncbi:lymphocyte cytosolic protein 2 isoform X2 [Perognathus longimembris pacificus]|uniref:lymphocyte cytosolic protein 2 isoform X2 n=1 Tax=Perognathus longimembris pacificus TaxID=214514 RepID=UPI002019002D|nr:lymphocyte cytosolic protein 2 isoform X2 [Perognathus longimembris pacificus]
MALSNVPFRSEVLAWDPDSLADYFRKLNYKDCEMAVRKYQIDGVRFLNLTENDIQKFPKLKMPILIRLSQDINRNEERRSIFTRRPHIQRFPEERESREEEEDGGWSSFEDDYESPDDPDDPGEDQGDYESPTEEEGAAPVDEADYEPPPSNDEEALQGAILPAQPLAGSGSVYIDRPPAGKAPQQPPTLPQRTLAGPPPPPASRGHLPLPVLQANHEEPSRGRSHKTPKLPAPSVDRSTKPPLDRSLALPDREAFLPGKKPVFADKPKALAGRAPGEHLPKTQKASLLCPADRPERGGLPAGKKPPVSKHGWVQDRRENDEEDVHRRPLPPPAPPSVSSSTFPWRSAKPSPKRSLPASHSPGAFAESSFPHSTSLPPYFSQGLSSRPPPRGEGKNFSLPVPSKPQPLSPGAEVRSHTNSLEEEWYVSYITRPEAEAALRKINQDGTFLVRDSSRKTITNPYVLMVLYKDKVYNIQIRYQEDSQVYLLGTGLRGKEDFLSVSHIIDYFRKMPLLLIDGKNRGSRYQCTLTHAAGCP